ncbi:MAG TPA: hypothetical protein VIL86_20780 [Tepidisphaeraceae bacterium]
MGFDKSGSPPAAPEAASDEQSDKTTNDDTESQFRMMLLHPFAGAEDYRGGFVLPTATHEAFRAGRFCNAAHATTIAALSEQLHDHD